MQPLRGCPGTYSPYVPAVRLLPTEAQFEYTLRAGSTTRFATGDSPQSLDGHANVQDASFEQRLPNVDYAKSPSFKFDDGVAFTAAVGSYPTVPTNAVGTGLSNYSITYANGTLTVNKATLTITASSASVTRRTVRCSSLRTQRSRSLRCASVGGALSGSKFAMFA